jgi:UDP-N-acetylmuramoyl-tripeptide--D-alanyl-D-alanine ligase
MYIDEKLLERIIDGARLVQGILPSGLSFSIDTRSLQSGDVFVALPGTVHDGHDFLAQACAQGCSGMIIQERKKDRLKALHDVLGDKFIITVPDTLQALIALAATWRQQFTIPIIAITGSVGKTSTKNLLAAMVAKQGLRYLISPGNYNTLLGVCLTLLQLRSYHEGAVFEIGITVRGEMACIAQVLRPTIGLITYIGHSHMAGLGSLHDIALEKRDIFKFFKEDAVGFINGDQPLLTGVSYQHPIIKFGSKTVNQIQARKITVGSTTLSFTLKIYKNRYTVTLPTNHIGSVMHALAASSVAHYLGIADITIVEALQHMSVVAGRFEKRTLKDGAGMLIHDSYNANPESMKAALLAFQRLSTSAQKIVVLGDMLELGADSAFWHRQIGRFLRKVPSLNHLILVGSHVQWTYKTVPIGLSVDIVKTWEDAIVKVRECFNQEVVVLVKGSLGTNLFKLVEQLTHASTMIHEH